MKFWTQLQAPSGNWVDVLGTDSFDSARDFAAWHAERAPFPAARVVAREDKVLIGFSKDGATMPPASPAHQAEAQNRLAGAAIASAQQAEVVLTPAQVELLGQQIGSHKGY